MVTQKMHLKKVIFWTEKLWHVTPKNAYLLFYQIKPKYARRNHRNSCDAFWCGKWYQAQLWLLDCIFSGLVAKTKYMHFSVSHVTFFRSQNRHFLGHFFARPLCSHFFLLFHKLILLFLRFEFAQESKNFWEMDMIDVQKSICRNLFGKIDAALGVLRNFFGRKIMAPLWCDKIYIVNFSLISCTTIPEHGGCRPSFAHNASDPFPFLHLWVFLNERNSGALNACATHVAYVNSKKTHKRMPLC